MTASDGDAQVMAVTPEMVRSLEASLPRRDQPFTGDNVVDAALDALAASSEISLDARLQAVDQCHRALHQRLQRP